MAKDKTTVKESPETVPPVVTTASSVVPVATDEAEIAMPETMATDALAVSLTHVTPIASTDNLANLLTDNPLFAKTYGGDIVQLTEYLQNVDLVKLTAALPDAYGVAVKEIFKRLFKKKLGSIGATATQMIELRLNHGVGSDPNRPAKMFLGEYYLSDGQIVGPDFTGLVLAVWTGHTMWPSEEESDGKRGNPLCSSMDRIVGSSFGECATCFHRPWKSKAERSNCAQDVVIVMLRDNLQDIALVRFSKTSTPAGASIYSKVNNDKELWSRWFKLTAAKKDNKIKNTQYHVMISEAVGMVDTALYPAVELLSIFFNSKIVYPGLASIYRQHHESASRTSLEISHTADVGDTSDGDVAPTEM